MKRLVYFIFIFLFGCNSQMNQHNSKFDGFHYPWDSLIIPKVFVYSRIDSTNLKSFEYQQVLPQGKDSFLIKSYLNAENMRDSSKFLISRQKINLIETYMIQKNRKGVDFRISKGEILEYVNEDLIRKSKIKFIDPFYKSDISVIQSNWKFDTLMTIVYKNKNYTCLIYSKERRLTLEHKGIFFIRKSFEKSIKSIFAKDLGLIQYTITDIKKSKNYFWKLDTIINYRDLKKQVNR